MPPKLGNQLPGKARSLHEKQIYIYIYLYLYLYIYISNTVQVHPELLALLNVLAQPHIANALSTHMRKKQKSIHDELISRPAASVSPLDVKCSSSSGFLSEQVCEMVLILPKF